MFIETYIALALLAILVPIALLMQAQRAYDRRRREIRLEQRDSSA